MKFRGPPKKGGGGGRPDPQDPPTGSAPELVQVLSIKIRQGRIQDFGKDNPSYCLL